MKTSNGLCRVEVFITDLDTGLTRRMVYPKVTHASWSVDFESRQDHYSDSLVTVYKQNWDYVSVEFAFKPLPYINNAHKREVGWMEQIDPALDTARREWYDGNISRRREAGPRVD